MNDLFGAAVQVQALCTALGCSSASSAVVVVAGLRREPLRTCSAENLVIHKVFAGRDRDWADVSGIIARQGDDLDVDLIADELAPLLDLKDDSQALGRLRAMLG